VAAVGFAAGASAEVISRGEDKVRAVHVEVVRAEGFGRGGDFAWRGYGEFVELAIGHEKRPG
jgi:hypothetical protein